MKAALYHEYGHPDVLKIEEVETPVPQKNELLIRVHATAVTSGDVRLRKADPFIARAFNGLFRPKNQILGMNYAGVVEDVGSEVRKFKRGESVFGSMAFGFGAYAEYVCSSENGVVVPKPSNLTFEEAAVVPFGTLTSLHFLREGNIKKGQKVLIYGASGSLGVAAIQIARYYEAEVTGVCSEKNFDLVTSLGADSVIDYTKEDFTKNDQTYDIIYDTVGKCPYSGSLKKLNVNGVFLRAVQIPPVQPLKALWTNLTSSKKVIGGITVERKEDLFFLKELIEEGKYTSVIDRTYPLERIAEAHNYVEQGHKKGNVAITVSE